MRDYYRILGIPRVATREEIKDAWNFSVKAFHGTGLNVSPAVHDYLGLAPTDVTDWQFVEVRDVPPGPWRS
jgi:curved DNA-binding protein CbpA